MVETENERRYYLAVAEKAEQGGWGVYFPDFPGCVSAGESFAQAAAGAHEALALHIEGMLEDGETLPASTPPDEIPRETWSRCMMVEASLPSRPIRLNISLDEGLVRRVDRAAEAQGMTRSGVLAAAARERLAAGSDEKRFGALLSALIGNQLPEIRAMLERHETVKLDEGSGRLIR